MKFGICRHSEGILIEVVPDEIGYTIDEIREILTDREWHDAKFPHNWYPKSVTAQTGANK